MKSICKYKNKVAFIQSEIVFEDDTRIEYLKIKKSQFLTSKDEEEIFNFIKKHACKNKIYNFVLHIDSETLRKLILHMAEKKIISTKTRFLLKKCKFIATYSNAEFVRVLNKEKEAGIMFALSPLSEVLPSIPNGSASSSTEPNNKEVMVVCSDSVSPYYNQLFIYFVSEGTTLVKYKVSELTVDLINNFDSNEGYMIVAALDTEAEYNAFGQTVKDSTFKKQVHFIECTQPQSVGVAKIQAKASDIQNSSSGVCINGIEFVGLNTLIAYEKCAAVLCQVWHCWAKLKKANIFLT